MLVRSLLARPRCPPPPDTAIVLVHGYLCLSRLYYWRGLRPLRRELRAAGRPVFHSCQPRTGSVASRAHQLARCLQRLPQRRLVLIGHSMGGLDARYVASRLDPERRIAHVVTLGTPHRGTVIADWALREPVPFSRLMRWLDRGALRDLTPERARRLNAEMPDRADVGYTALGGVCPSQDLAGSWRWCGELVAREEGPNDGIIALRSALRGPDALALSADHLELIGQGARPGAGVAAGRGPATALAALRQVLHRLLPGMPGMEQPG
ncbi:MAG: alpha/beta fold hydrolase [Geminicoccaceae bacterium]